MERIFPFFWVTGKKVDFKAEIAAIANCGIKSFCVESRIHPDFCGDSWWEDFDEILRYAEENGHTITGPARGILLASVCEDEKLNGYFEVWIPIA